MSNEATIIITETNDGVTITIASENRTAALIAALRMVVQQLKATCEREGIMGEVSAERPFDIN